MARLFLIALLVLLNGGPAFAEWVSIGSTQSNGGYTIYVDPDSIRRKGNLAKMWSLYDYKILQTDTPDSYFSSKAQHEYDCTEERMRILAVTFFSGQMGSGHVVHSDSDEDKWSPVAPESIGRSLWKIACAIKK